MERWVDRKGKHLDVPEVEAFLRDLVEVCKKHGMWLGHQDGHGAFQVESESTEAWLMAAHDSRRP